MNKGNYNMLKEKIIAIESHFNSLGVKFTIEEHKYSDRFYANDFNLMLNFKNETYRFRVNVKKQLAGTTALNMIKKNNNDCHILYLAEYISPMIEESLMKNKISFINTSGKVFIHQGRLLLYFDFPKRTTKSVQIGAAFETTGIKFIYHLLNKPESINKTYQELADILQISSGSISNIINDLKRSGFVYTIKNKRILRNKRELLDQWYVAYGRKLRPKIVIGKYRQIANARNIQLPGGYYWGGEVAAELMSLNLRSQNQVIYTERDSVSAIKELRLIPDENGMLEVLRAFWNPKTDYEHSSHIVPKILIYADLMLSKNDRNLEIANELYK